MCYYSSMEYNERGYSIRSMWTCAMSFFNTKY
nr:MAG TPA: hypothetical protein [Caudoviricetes sp.]DAS64736.1 MAG TPA: hypothetical protein [Caudoviricetes sp.]DAX61935.1 MAG TPA: hypothetical protein [Caudoviricetes sp.]